MEVGKLTLLGIDVVSIENINIEAECNKHATLKLDCLIAKEDIAKCEMYTNLNQPVTLKHDGKILFSGKVMELKCRVEIEGAHLLLTIKNCSIDLDLVKKCKSYQDTKKTYQEVVESKCRCLFNTENKVTGELIIQYQETDWDFLCRVASKCNQPIYTDMANAELLLYWGIEKGRPIKDIEIRNVVSTKDLRWQQDMTQNDGVGLSVSDAVTYIVESPDFLKVGDAIEVNGKVMYVYKLLIDTNQAELRGYYYVKTFQGMSVPKIYYTDLAGVGLQGKIICSQGTDVKVHLDMDDVQDEATAYLFPFSAMQAAADGSGWYYMPEVGDCIKVCIPAWEESGAFAVSAVSTYDGADDAEDKMGDTSDKYMRNPSGKEVHVTNSGISLGAGKDVSALDMDVNGDINLFGNSTVSFDASENVEITAVGDLNIKASEMIDIHSDATGELRFNDAGEIDELGGQVNINAEE